MTGRGASEVWRKAERLEGWKAERVGGSTRGFLPAFEPFRLFSLRMIMSRAAKAWLFIVCLVTALAAVLTPAWVIQPFRPQSGGWLAFSLVLRRVSPWITIVLLGAIAFLTGNL